MPLDLRRHEFSPHSIHNSPDAGAAEPGRLPREPADEQAGDPGVPYQDIRPLGPKSHDGQLCGCVHYLTCALSFFLWLVVSLAAGGWWRETGVWISG